MDLSLPRFVTRVADLLKHPIDRSHGHLFGEVDLIFLSCIRCGGFTDAAIHAVRRDDAVEEGDS